MLVTPLMLGCTGMESYICGILIMHDHQFVFINTYLWFYLIYKCMFVPFNSSYISGLLHWRRGDFRVCMATHGKCLQVPAWYRWLEHLHWRIWITISWLTASTRRLSSAPFCWQTAEPLPSNSYRVNSLQRELHAITSRNDLVKRVRDYYEPKPSVIVQRYWRNYVAALGD